MSRTVNKVILLGNIGRKPDVNYTPTGIKVAHMRLATEDNWVDKDGSLQGHTDWHTVVAWRGLADVVERLVDRGTRIYVEGHIRTRTYDDKEGRKKYVVEIVAEQLLVLDARKADKDRANGTEEHEIADADSGNEIDDPDSSAAPPF
ncbi:MAG: single-stranded DNA-binding protein [Ignavibacteria bacterium]|nr:single-stranded DNA-binding protein [Ignavibacteria bacterium]